MVDVTPIPKAPKRTKVSGVRVQKAGTAAALKRKATKLWGEYIHQRDRVCQVCGKADGKLDAHHILIKSYMATRADPANGVLLCASHHTLGKDSVHNDPVFAVNFYSARLGIDGYEALQRKARDGVNGRYPASFWKERVDELERLLGYQP
jgi:hypothetical protein